jgi:hypothetical protein
MNMGFCGVHRRPLLAAVLGLTCKNYASFIIAVSTRENSTDHLLFSIMYMHCGAKAFSDYGDAES